MIEDVDVPEVHPWIRLFARTLDGIIASIVILGLWVLISPDSYIKWAYSYGRYISITLIIWTFVEALLLSTWGTTPGKWLLRVKVRDLNGKKLTYIPALYRALSVWGLGEGCGIGFVSIITYTFSNFRLVSKGITAWDEKGEFRVSHKPVGYVRGVIAAVTLIGIPFIIYYTGYATI
jgi:uncharacterized RDD family membrane protein YckC